MTKVRWPWTWPGGLRAFFLLFGWVWSFVLLLDEDVELSKALPGLQRFCLRCVEAVAGEALVHPATKLTQLASLVVCALVQPGKDAVAAAVAAQMQAVSGARAGVLTIDVRVDEEELEDVLDSAARLLESGLLGSPQRVILIVR